MGKNDSGVKALSSKDKALIKAVQDGGVKEVTQLLEQGANVNCSSDRWSRYVNVTPLMLAAEAGHPKVVKVLLANGANVSATDKTDALSGGEATALHYALQLYEAGKFSLEVVRLLLEAGADPNARLANTDTALDWASFKGLLDVVKLMLKHGGKPNASIGCGRGPALHRAADQAELSIVKILLAAGADVNGEDKGGNTPIFGAAVMERAVNHGVGFEDYLPTIKFLLASGANVNHVSQRGRTALIAATETLMRTNSQECYDTWFPMIKFLVEKANAELNIRDKTGQTALDYALLSDYPALPEYLRKRGGVSGSA